MIITKWAAVCQFHDHHKVSCCMSVWHASLVAWMYCEGELLCVSIVVPGIPTAFLLFCFSTQASHARGVWASLLQRLLLVCRSSNTATAQPSWPGKGTEYAAMASLAAPWTRPCRLRSWEEPCSVNHCPCPTMHCAPRSVSSVGGGGGGGGGLDLVMCCWLSHPVFSLSLCLTLSVCLSVSLCVPPSPLFVKDQCLKVAKY